MARAVVMTPSDPVKDPKRKYERDSAKIFPREELTPGRLHIWLELLNPTD
jgi:hypothetical protein